MATSLEAAKEKVEASLFEFYAKKVEDHPNFTQENMSLTVAKEKLNSKAIGSYILKKKKPTEIGSHYRVFVKTFDGYVNQICLLINTNMNNKGFSINSLISDPVGPTESIDELMPLFFKKYHDEQTSEINAPSQSPDASFVTVSAAASTSITAVTTATNPLTAAAPSTATAIAVSSSVNDSQSGKKAEDKPVAALQFSKPNPPAASVAGSKNTAEEAMQSITKALTENSELFTVDDLNKLQQKILAMKTAKLQDATSNKSASAVTLS